MVGKTQDYNLQNTKFRSFTPEGAAPSKGWPVLIYFHGGEIHITNLLVGVELDRGTDLRFLGGWTLGNIGSETAMATNMCVRTSFHKEETTYNMNNLLF